MRDPERLRLAELSRELSRIARDVPRRASQLTPEEAAALDAVVVWLHSRAAEIPRGMRGPVVRNNYAAVARTLAALARRLG